MPRSKSQRVSKLVEFLSKKCAPWTGPMQPAARSPNTADRQQNKTKGSEFGIHLETGICLLLGFLCFLAGLLVGAATCPAPETFGCFGWAVTYMDGLWELLLGIILANPCGYNVSLAVKSIQLLQHWPCFYHPLQWPLDVAGCNGRFPGAWPDFSESGNVTAQPFLRHLAWGCQPLIFQGGSFCEVFLWSLFNSCPDHRNSFWCVHTHTWCWHNVISAQCSECQLKATFPQLLVA